MRRSFTFQIPSSPEYQQDLEWLLREKYNGIVCTDFERDARRVSDGEPLAYVIGHVPFLDSHIDLSRRPLIPRPETEFWVDKLVKGIRSAPELRILDVFAGSGCVGVSILCALPHARVHFAEIDPGFCEQIEYNLERNRVTARGTVLRSDVFSAACGPYDLIVANPPYIRAGDRSVQPAVLRWEPHDALFAPHAGLALLRNTLSRAWRLLRPGGQLWCEFGTGQQWALRALLRGLPQYQSSRLCTDQYGRWRYLVAQTRTHSTPESGSASAWLPAHTEPAARVARPAYVYRSVRVAASARTRASTRGYDPTRFYSV
jgi:HemK-like putative methylase